MTRLLFFKEEGRAENYGIGTYCKYLLNHLSKYVDLNIHVVVLRSFSSHFERLCDGNNMTYYYIPNVFNDNDKDEIKRVYYKRVWYLIYPYFANDENDNCILHLNYWDHIAIVDLYRKYIPNGKVCFTLHYFEWCFELKGNTALYKEIISSQEKNFAYEKITMKYALEIEYLKMVDIVIALSKYTKGLLLDIYKLKDDKISLIYNGLEECRETNDADIKRIRDEFGYSEQDNLVLFVGRLDRIKGVKYLLEAFAEALNKDRNLRLIIVGNGDYDEYIKFFPYLSNKIRFTGKIDRDLLYKIYSISDIGVLPSFHEQCSYVIIEMLMHSLPVIASDSTGLNEMISEGINGFHIHVEYIKNTTSINIESFADKIIYIFNDLRLMKKLGCNSKEIYKNKYTLEAMGMNVKYLYTHLLS